VWRQYVRTPGAAWIALVVACVGSRLATTITYIEDPDSLRFALSVADAYDVAALQPHFPGYPVFWAVAKSFYVPTGSFSASFSIVGGLATVGVVWALLRLRDVALRSVEGATIAGAVFVCPLLWLMANRYMPDLLGTACVLAALALLTRALRPDGEQTDERAARAGIVLTSLLAGLRLSYLPLVIVPALWVLRRSARPARLIGVGTLSVAVWLLPMILDTGFWTLVDVAWGQTTGHFTEFGGTVQTESDLGRRVTGLVQGLWADGLGGWGPGRHPLTAVVGVGGLGLGGLGAWRLGRNAGGRHPSGGLLVLCALLYAVWIFFGQNVVHKSRHVLPLLPLLLLLPAAGAASLWRGAWGRRAVVLGAAGAYAVVTLVLVNQHRSPSAVAQAKQFVERQAERPPPTRVASVPLVNTYLRTQQVDARFLSIEDSSDVRRLRRATEGRTIVVGTYASLLDRSPDRIRRFYHNPHVNRMWPEVTVYVYEHDPR
jgi:4-amino-4-deoxy-L-arabinose transferase-like glycosyltransferase